MAAQSSTNPPLPAKVIDRLFQRLSLNYGKHFLDLWKDVPMDQLKQEWAQGLAGFNAQEITDALTYTLERSKFPPTLPEFKALCKEHRRAPVMQALPRKFTKEELQENRQRLKGIMDGLAARKEMPA